MEIAEQFQVVRVLMPMLRYGLATSLSIYLCCHSPLATLVTISHFEKV